MHLHGHHDVVLSRDGDPASGSPWWSRLPRRRRRQTYEVAFVADNPGIWMDHCHNLQHAADGLHGPPDVRGGEHAVPGRAGHGEPPGLNPGKPCLTSAVAG